MSDNTPIRLLPQERTFQILKYTVNDIKIQL
jgi:hypothetical protein